jgi:hypothetical protein
VLHLFFSQLAALFVAGNLDGQWATAQAGDALRAAALQTQIGGGFKLCLNPSPARQTAGIG